MNNKTPLLVFSLFAGIGFTAGAPAEEQILEGVIVTDTRLDEDVKNLPASITVISEADIRNSTAKTLSEFLGQQASVINRSLFGNNSVKDAVGIRSFGMTATQNTLILLDGRRLNDVDLSSVDFTAIPIDNIARIEIMRGTGSVLYGDGAVAGAINIVTKTPGKSGTSGRVATSFGSYSEGRTSVSVLHNAGAFSAYMASEAILSSGYRDNNDLKQANLQAGLQYALDNQELYLKFGGDNQELRLPGPRTVDPSAGIDELKTDRRGTGTPNDYADQRGRFITAGYGWYMDNGSEFIIDANQREKGQDTFSDFGGGFTDYWESQLVTRSITPRYKWKYGKDSQQGALIVGVDYYKSNYRSDRGISPDTIKTPVHKLNIEQDSRSVYAQDTHTFGKRAVLNIGARYQNVSLKATDDFDPTAPGGAFDSGAADFDQSDNEYMYDLGLRYRFGPRLSVYGNLNRSARFATVDELYEFDPATFTRVFSPLKPQTGTGLTTGLDFGGKSLQAYLSTYYMALENEIHFSPATFTNDNLDPTEHYGADLDLRYRLMKSVDTGLSYAYTRALFRDGPFKGNDIPMVPIHTASADIGWRILPGLRLSLIANYVGKKRFDNDQANTFKSIPGYTFVDLKLGGQIDGWQLSAAVYNLTNKEAFDYGVISTFTAGKYNAYPLPTRNYFFTLSKQISTGP